MGVSVVEVGKKERKEEGEKEEEEMKKEIKIEREDVKCFFVL